MMGLVLPFSPFFITVLEEYTIHLVHLTPNAIATLVIFVHACEMFVCVQPSVELLHYFFSFCCSPKQSPGPRDAPQARTMRGCYFRIRQRMSHKFIAFLVKNN